MTKQFSLERFPLHLGLGTQAVPQPEFNYHLDINSTYIDYSICLEDQTALPRPVPCWPPSSIGPDYGGTGMTSLRRPG